MSDGSAARTYHELTSYSPPDHYGAHDDPRMVQGYVPLQPERKPPQAKSYPGIEQVEVPDHLSDLLFLSAGVVRYRDVPGLGRLWFRAAGSAGNLHPLEVYVLTAGEVFHYDGVAHALTPLGRASGPGEALVVTGVPWRTGWKYTERGYRHLWWDCGTMLAHVLALTSEARLVLGFVDAEVAAVVGADGLHELPLAVVALDGEPPLRPVGDHRPAGFVDDDPLVFPLVVATNDAGSLPDSDAVARWRVGEARRAPRPNVTFGRAPLSDVIRRRGSTRAFDPAAVAPAELLVHAFAAATAPLQADFLEDGGTLLDHHVLVHAVDGVEAGGYRWTGDGFERVDAYGDTRRVGRHLTLNQDLGGDGCYTAFHGADLDAVLTRLGTRGYRCAQLEAGVVEGRLHLAAFALGFGASGLTFFDDAVRRHFATRSWPMLCTAVGRPAYRSRAGGLPGAPTRLG